MSFKDTHLLDVASSCLPAAGILQAAEVGQSRCVVFYVVPSIAMTLMHAVMLNDMSIVMTKTICASPSEWWIFHCKQPVDGTEQLSATPTAMAVSMVTQSHPVQSYQLGRDGSGTSPSHFTYQVYTARNRSQDGFCCSIPPTWEVECLGWSHVGLEISIDNMDTQRLAYWPPRGVHA